MKLERIESLITIFASNCALSISFKIVKNILYQRLVKIHKKFNIIAIRTDFQF